MKCKGLKSRIRNNKLTIGTWLTIGHTSVVEVLAQAGFDWIAIDVEHNLINPDMLRQLIITGQSKGVSMFVRIVENDEVYLKYALDAGAGGIIIPMVESPSQLEEIIGYSCWPPVGKRGVGYSRANLFGKYFNPNDEVSLNPLIIAQIENIEAVKEIEQILKVPGLDAIIIGPYDLSASMAITGQFSSKKFQDCLKKILNSCKKFNIPYGIHIIQPDINELNKRINEKYQFIAYSIDAVMLSVISKNPKK